MVGQLGRSVHSGEARGEGADAVAPADRRTLIRRLSFDLSGLPPTPEEVEAFVADARPDAYERLVDRCWLRRPTANAGAVTGSTWRAMPTRKGYVFQEERRYPFAYTYRDYVVECAERDLPYDRFIVEQIAADRLVAGSRTADHLAALGFLTLGRRFLNNVHDIIDDRIDVVTRGLHGSHRAVCPLPRSQVRPDPDKDYYSLYGVFASSNEPKELPLLIADPTEATEATTVFATTGDSTSCKAR